MTAHLPPVPPENQSDKGPGEPAQKTKDMSRANAVQPGRPAGDTDKPGQSSNIHQNTTHPGQQGR